MSLDMKTYIEKNRVVVRSPQDRIDELLAANIRFEKRARDAEDTYAALQKTADEAIKTANRYRAEGAHITNTSRGMTDVLTERGKHSSHGFDDKHDDEHQRGEIAYAAIAYASEAVATQNGMAKWVAAFNRAIEPWPIAYARTPRTNLVCAAALLIAEIDRIDRAATQKVTS